MAIKLAEQTNGPHIFMRLRLDSGRVEEIDAYGNAGFHKHIAPSCGWLPLLFLIIPYTVPKSWNFSILGRFSYFMDIRERVQK